MSDHGSHGEEARKRRSFTPEFKAEMVDLCQRGSVRHALQIPRL
jgi:transposase-like protein